MSQKGNGPEAKDKPNKETPQSVSQSISSALFYLEGEAEIIGMRRLAAQIHLAAIEAQVLTDDLSSQSSSRVVKSE